MSELEGPERGLPRVAGSEAQLIQLARTLVGSEGRYVPLLRRRQKLSGQVGPTAMALLQQTLARGVTLQLLRRGGWQRRGFMVGTRVVRGRLWERHSLPALHFGPASFELLAWMVREDVVRPSHDLLRRSDATIADDLLHYFAMDHLLRVGGRPDQQPAFREAPIVQLAWPDALGRESDLPALDFGSLATSEAFVVEALTPDLARRWVEMERSKAKLTALAEMTRLGAAQRSVADRFLDALERADPARRDLASFLVEAGEMLLRQPLDHRWWIANLDLRASLAERQRAFAGALAFLAALARIAGWVEQAGLVAHFEDEYDAAQLILANWQGLRSRSEGPSGFDRAGVIARDLASLHSLAL